MPAKSIKQLTTEERRKTFIARPILHKYFEADLSIKKEAGFITGMSELLNNILDKHYASLPDTDKKLLLTTYEKLNK